MSSRHKPPTLDYANASQLSVPTGLEPLGRYFWIAAALIFTATFAAAGGEGWVNALIELFMQLPLLILWTGAAFGWGCVLAWAGRPLLSVDQKTALGAVTTIALGLGAMSLATLGLGLAGGMNRPAAFAMTLGGAAISMASLVRAKPTPCLRVPVAHWPWLAVVPTAAIVALCALLPAGLLWGMGEPNGYDVVGYHLQVPREWYEAGRITGLHHNVYSYFPFNVEMHYLLAMHLTGGPWAGQFLSQLMHGVYVALSVVAVYAAVRPYGRGRAVTAALLAAAPPWMPMLGSIAYNEGGLLLYGTLAIAWVLNAEREEAQDEGVQRPAFSVPRFLIAGVMAGLAAGCKLTAVPILIVGLPIALLIVNWRQWKGIAVFVIAAVLTFSPWLIRNAVWTGNPVFPEMQSVLGRGHFSKAQSERWYKAHKPRPDQQAYNVRVAELGRQVFADWRFAYVVLPLGLVAMLLAFRRREVQVLLILLAILTVFWLTQTHLQGRFYVLAIPIAAMAVALVPGKQWTGVVFTLGGIAVIAGTVMLYNKLWSVRFTFSKRGVPLMQAVGANIASPPSDAAANVHRRYVFVGNGAVFHVDLPMSRLVYRTVFDADTSNQGVMEAWTVDVRPGETVRMEIADDELARYHRTYGLPALPLFARPEDMVYVKPK